MKEITKLKLQRFVTSLGQGFAMGAFAGMTVGLVVGTLGVMISGPSPGKTYISTVGKQMIQTVLCVD
jgi:hypothetical protein